VNLRRFLSQTVFSKLLSSLPGFKPIITGARAG
jgi:hypothetical protein